jgi:alpha-L-fucosidase
MEVSVPRSANRKESGATLVLMIVIRPMMKQASGFSHVATTLFLFTASLFGQNFVDLKPTPQQIQWQDLEFGVIIHLGTNTYLDREWGDGTADPQLFNPAQFDPEQWMRAIKSSGAKYVVLVAKHHDGFCLWPTEQTTYSVKSSPWKEGKGDVVREVSDAAHKFGLKFGVYLSPWDRHEPRYANSADYDKFYLAQLSELAQNYGELVEFWLDGAGSAGHVYDFPRFIEELRTYQPNTLVFADTGLFEYGDIRWVGNEEGKIPYENWNVIDRHGYLRWRPMESDTPLHKGHWFWHPNDEQTLKSVAELVSTYEQTVGRGGQLMLGIAPDRRGLLPDADARRLEEFGVAIRQRYGRNLMDKRIRSNNAWEAALDGDANTFWDAPHDARQVMLEVSFAEPQTFDRAITMEWLNEGQHIEQYRMEAWDGKRWNSIIEGRAIGQEKIDRFPAVTASRVRLNILAASGEIRIREFQLYDVDGHH